MVVLYYLLYAFVWLLFWLPLPILYGISYILYFLAYHVVKYRRDVVRDNLTSCFPEKSKEEIIDIEKRFYLFFADTAIETLKLIHLSKDEIKERFKINNPEELQRLFEKGRSAMIVLGHYGSWEWSPSLYLHYHGVTGAEMYRPIKNPYLNKFFLKLRSIYGTETLPKNESYRYIVKYLHEGKVFGLGLIADQTPSIPNLHFWTHFLNHPDTPFLNGPERIARKADLAFVYLDVKRVKRGYYSCDLITLTEHAKETQEDELTQRYAELMERTILRDPAYWLWSHRRWKHKRNKENN